MKQQWERKIRVIYLTLVALFGLAHHQVHSQSGTVSIENFPNSERLSPSRFDSLLQEYGRNKSLPAGYEQQAILALSHFPELKNTSIVFRFHKSHATLKTRIQTSSLLNDKKKRFFVITISSRTVDKLEPVRFSNMNFDAQVGILGHEISHVLDFSEKNLWQCTITGMKHTSPAYVDSLEFHTDMITIQHGLGKELYAWSSFIRKTMHVQNWRGADYVNDTHNTVERYMNPDTILRKMTEYESGNTKHSGQN